MQIIAHVYIHNFFIAAAGAEDAYTERTGELARHCCGLSPRVQTAAENEAFIDLSAKSPPAVRVLGNLAEKLAPGLGSFVTISLAPCPLLAKAATLVQLSASQRFNQYSARISPAIPGLVTRTRDKFRLCVVSPAAAGDFTSRLPVELMWPVEGNVIKRLKALGLNSFGDVSAVPPALLYGQFGPLAPLITDYSRGIDKKTIPVFRDPGTVVYHSYCEGADRLGLEELIKQAAAYIGKTLQERGESYRELALSIFFEETGSKTKASTFARGKHEIRSVFYDCINLLNKLATGRWPLATDKTVIDGRVTGITVTAGSLVLTRGNQLTIFEDPKTLNSRSPGHKAKLDAVCRNLAARYSPGVITTGSALPVARREQMLMFVDPLRNQ